MGVTTVEYATEMKKPDIWLVHWAFQEETFLAITKRGHDQKETVPEKLSQLCQRVTEPGLQ